MSNEYVRMRKSTMDSIAKAIQEKEGSADPIPGAEMPARIEALGGGLALETKAREISFPSLNVLGEADAKINLDSATSLESLFRVDRDEDINTTVEHLTINCPNQVGSMSKAIAGRRDVTLKRITLNVDTSAATIMIYVFYGDKALEIIDGTPIDASKSTSANALSGIFEYCSALKFVKFKGTISTNISFNSSEWLEKECILNVFSCLSDETSGLTATFHKRAVNRAFETSEGAADGSTSEEWLALVDTKPNWTISLRS